MDSDVVGNNPLQLGNQRAAHDRAYQNPGSFSRQGTQSVDSQSKDARKHDGVEKTDCEDAPHGKQTRREH